MTLRFLHIPKTAGTTFETILKRQYRGKPHFSFNGDIPSDLVRYHDLPELERKNIELFAGHAPFGTGIAEADHGTIITFLREPVSRVKSFCQHVAEGKSAYLRDDVPPETFDLDEFLESGNPELSNLQSKMLVNSGSSVSDALLKDKSVSEAKEMVLANLFGRIAHFGLTEFFDESLMIFSQALHWSPPLYVSINRKDPARLIKFEERHLRRIRELNAIDLEVYQAARTRFIEIIQGPQFSKTKLSLFRSLNAVFPVAKRIQSQIKAL